MFAWGIKRRDAREVLGQVVRLIGAPTKTAIGLVPSGNTGGSNISPVQRVPIPADLAAIKRRSEDDAVFRSGFVAHRPDFKERHESAGLGRHKRGVRQRFRASFSACSAVWRLVLVARFQSIVCH
jgi:hypothetical protein